MQNYKKGFFIVISVLLSLILITTAVLSGIFAKYVSQRSSDAEVTFKKWGIEVSTGTGLLDEYVKDEVIYVKSKGGVDDKVIAPGTSGVLVWISVEGTPEVPYDIDIDGSLLIGDGYHTQPHPDEEDAAVCSNEGLGLLRYSGGGSFDYLPIIFKLYKTVDGVKTLEKIYRLGDTSLSCDDKDYLNGSGVAMAKQLSNDVSTAFDGQKAANTAVNIVYSLEWEWLYEPTPAEGIEYEGFSGFKHSHQTTEKDTALGEALNKYSALNELPEDDAQRCKLTKLAPFDIVAEMTIEVSQVQE